MTKSMTTPSFFYKRLVCKQIALGCKIAEQLSGLNTPSLSNNESHRLRKSGAFSL